MAATTISAYSDEITLNRPPLYAPLPPDKEHGRVRTASFRLTLASQVSGTSFAVSKIPKGARILGGTLTASAALANSATLAVGLTAIDGLGNIDDALASGPGYKPDGSAVTVGTVVSDSTTCLKAAAVQSTTQVSYALTQALGYLYKTAKDVWITLTTGAGTVSTEVVTGHVTYVID